MAVARYIKTEQTLRITMGVGVSGKLQNDRNKTESEGEEAPSEQKLGQQKVCRISI